MAASKKTTPKQPIKRPKSKATLPDTGDDKELSPAQSRELEKRVKDLEDRTRYMLVSTLGPSFVLYYNVSEDTYGWNDPAHATLFKRRQAAEAIQQVLGDKDGIVQCAVDKKGQLVKKSVEPTTAKSTPKSTAKTAPKSTPKKAGKTNSAKKMPGRKNSGKKKPARR